jgi:hypothetical protein
MCLKEIPADVGLHQNAEGVPPVADDVGLSSARTPKAASTAAMTAKKVR